MTGGGWFNVIAQVSVARLYVIPPSDGVAVSHNYISSFQESIFGIWIS